MLKKLTIVNANSRGFTFPKDKSNSPLVIDLPCDLTNIELPTNILKLDVFAPEEDDKYICSIYVGEVFPEKLIRAICPNYIYCDCFDVTTLKEIKPDTPCVFYKDIFHNYVIVAKLNPEDLTVATPEELKKLLIDLSTSLTLSKPLTRTRKKDI